MTATHWTRIAALTAALGLTGAAIAQNTEGTTSTRDRASVSNSTVDTPSSGAIVTPEDKALGMGRNNAREGVRNGDDEASPSNDDALSINPGPSNDDESSTDPGQSNDEDISVDPTRPDADRASPRYARPALPGSVTNRDCSSIRDDENEACPPRTGSDEQPAGMGPGSMRGK